MRIKEQETRLTLQEHDGDDVTSIHNIHQDKMSITIRLYLAKCYLIVIIASCLVVCCVLTVLNILCKFDTHNGMASVSKKNGSLSAGDRRWFKRSTGKKVPGQETSISHNNNNNNNNNSDTLFSYYNSSQRMRTITLKSQHHYSTPTATCFGPYWSIIREHTVVPNSRLTLYACSRAAQHSSV